MRLAEIDGANAYEVNLPALGDYSDDDLKVIFGAAKHPVYTTCRRADFMAVYGIDPATLPHWDEESRMERQLAALTLGSVGIDMEMDTFDPHPAPAIGSPAFVSFAASIGSPAELTHDTSAIAKQQEIIERVHAAGGEVILSCHTGRPQSTTGLIEIAEIAAGRGANRVKVVSPCLNLEDLFALLAAISHLKAHLEIPVMLLGAGDYGALSRLIGANLGSGWMLAQQDYVPGGFHGQPLVSVSREIRRLIPWKYEK